MPKPKVYCPHRREWRRTLKRDTKEGVRPIAACGNCGLQMSMLSPRGLDVEALPRYRPEYIKERAHALELERLNRLVARLSNRVLQQERELVAAGLA